MVQNFVAKIPPVNLFTGSLVMASRVLRLRRTRLQIWNTKVKFSLCVTNHHFMDTYLGMEVIIHAFLSSVIGREGCLTSCSVCLTLGQRAPYPLDARTCNWSGNSLSAPTGNGPDALWSSRPCKKMLYSGIRFVTTSQKTTVFVFRAVRI
jgi:hypothetical protein